MSKRRKKLLWIQASERKNTYQAVQQYNFYCYLFDGLRVSPRNIDLHQYTILCIKIGFHLILFSWIRCKFIFFIAHMKLFYCIACVHIKNRLIYVDLVKIFLFVKKLFHNLLTRALLCDIFTIFIIIITIFTVKVSWNQKYF